MAPPAPWSPTAHAFAQHQFSHVANFWKQGRQASFRLEALPGGRAELNVTFQLPPASEVVPPPFHPVPAHHRLAVPSLAVPSLPPPKDDSLRHVALACVRRLQAASALPVSTPSSNKRPFPDSPNTPSPSNPPPLAQRIRSDFQISEGEVEFPERESNRSQLYPDSFPPLKLPS